MATRNHLILYLNGKRREVHGGDCFLSLSDFLRYRLGLVGTKIVCSEGDCGSCTVLIGRPNGSELDYRPVDSCIQQMFQLDGVHVVSIEGLAGEPPQFAPAAAEVTDRLTPVQQAMVECHGSQCGFCTPGFVMAMAGHQEHCNGHAPTEDDWRHALTGNLCRCTGYVPILNAAQHPAVQNNAKLNAIYPPAAMLAEFAELRGDSIEVFGDCAGIARRVFSPTTLAEAIAIRQANPQAKIVAGATDVGVQLNKRVIEPTVFLDLNRVSELVGITINGGTIVAGARATWTQLLDIFRNEVPAFAEIVSVFGSPQIRHVGTIGGNIVNASPIADSLPFLFVMEAELELAGAAGRRRVNINDFYLGYKKLDLRPDELLAAVHIPLPQTDEMLRLYKISRRRDLDISTFTAALRIELSGDTIAQAAIAYGAVGPTVLRLRRTEQFLQGQPFSEQTMQAAGELAVEEITPISDVRGSQDYRLQLARNVLLKFYHELQAALSN
ncbi:MAG TPA: FAD binding domain-containing protein [Pirellulales bacterium]|jgi:xanthine dehydrogenase small subunit